MESEDHFLEALELGKVEGPDARLAATTYGGRKCQCQYFARQDQLDQERR